MSPLKGLKIISLKVEFIEDRAMPLGTVIKVSCMNSSLQPPTSYHINILKKLMPSLSAGF